VTLGAALLAAGAAVAGRYASHDAMAAAATAFALLFDIALPYLVSNNRYFLCHFRVIGLNGRVLGILRCGTAAVAAPMLLGALFAEDCGIPCWLAAIITVCAINRALTEPHVFAIALLISTLGGRFEMLGWKPSLVTLFSLAVARKFFSAWPILDYYMRVRPILLSFSDVSDEDWWYVALFAIVTWFYDRLPFIDGVVSFPSLVWSLATGAPFNVPHLWGAFILPSAPRPNAFWDVSDGQRFDVRRAFTASLTEHPIETPVYTSVASALALSLALSLVNFGRLGVVDSNDMFLFSSGSMAFFVHIVAREAHGVRFQMRGLEYRHETACQRGELSRLHRNIDYHGRFPNAVAAVQYMVTNWQIRRIGVPLMMYDVSRVELGLAFVGISPARALGFARLAFASAVARAALAPESWAAVPANACAEGACDMLQALPPFDFACDAETAARIGAVWTTLERDIFNSHGTVNHALTR